MSTLAIVLRFLHIAPAIIAGGATIFVKIALLPALATLPEAERARLKDAIDRRWRLVVMACVTLSPFFLHRRKTWQKRGSNAFVLRLRRDDVQLC